MKRVLLVRGPGIEDYDAFCGYHLELSTTGCNDSPSVLHWGLAIAAHLSVSTLNVFCARYFSLRDASLGCLITGDFTKSAAQLN